MLKFVTFSIFYYSFLHPKGPEGEAGPVGAQGRAGPDVGVLASDLVRSAGVFAQRRTPNVTNPTRFKVGFRA